MYKNLLWKWCNSLNVAYMTGVIGVGEITHIRFIAQEDFSSHKIVWFRFHMADLPKKETLQGFIEVKHNNW